MSRTPSIQHATNATIFLSCLIERIGLSVCASLITKYSTLNSGCLAKLLNAFSSKSFIKVVGCWLLVVRLRTCDLRPATYAFSFFNVFEISTASFLECVSNRTFLELIAKPSFSRTISHTQSFTFSFLARIIAAQIMACW